MIEMILENLMHDIELQVPFCTPTIYCNNKSVVAISYNPVLHARTKHMEIDNFFVREKVLTKQLFFFF